MYYARHTPSPTREAAPSPPLQLLYNVGVGVGVGVGPVGPGPQATQGGAYSGVPVTARNYQQQLLQKLTGPPSQYNHAPPHHPSHHHHHHQSFSYPAGPQPGTPTYPQLPSGPSSHPSHHPPHHPHAPPNSLSHPIGPGPPHAPPPPPPTNGVISHNWQEQIRLLNISRTGNLPHHHARAAQLAYRNAAGAQGTTVTDPTKPSRAPVGPHGAPYHKKESSVSVSRGVNGSGSGGVTVNGSGSGNAGGSAPGSGVGSIVVDEAEAARTGTGPKQSSNASDGSGETDDEQWTAVDLGGLRLKVLSLELFRFTFLTNLYAPHNEITVLPSAISSLVNLTVLDLSHNKIASLPPELGMLTNLRELFLFDNHLTNLPSELGTLHQLERMGIEGNPLPDTLRKMLDESGASALIAYLRDSCPVPMPPPEREWVSVDPETLDGAGDEDGSGGPPPETFSVVSYNILGERYASSTMYGYTPSWALIWDYRKELILHEILNYEADVLCLQEVDLENYEDYFLANLDTHDYQGVHFARSRARTMSADERRHVDGCAIFFKKSTFALVEERLIEFNQIAMRRPDFKKTEDMFNRVMTRDHIAAVALLEHKQSGARLIVANAHLYWDPRYSDVKLVQTAMLMDELDNIGSSFARLSPRFNLGEAYDQAPTYDDATKIPTIVCGDFNSVRGTGVHDFLAKGHVEPNHRDFGKHIYGTYTSHGASHRLQLKSAYETVGEIPFTNYTPGYRGVIDYIWYTANSLQPTGVLGEVDREYASKIVGFPNSHFASDHISIVAEFQMKKQGKSGGAGKTNGVRHVR